MHERTFSKILIVRLSSLGDVVQTLPVASVLRRTFPHSQIGWAIDRELAPAIDGHPDIDRVHLCDRMRWSRNLKNPLEWKRTLREARKFIEEIRGVGYDCALDVQGLLKSAVIPFFARISPRIGFNHGRELTHFFYTERYLSNAEYFDPNCMHVDHMMVLARAIGCDTGSYVVRPPRVSCEARTKISALLRQGLNRDHPLVIIAPGTQWRSKQWPYEHWLSLLRLLLSRTDASVALIGSTADQSLAARLAHASGAVSHQRVLNLAGMTSTPELYALFERATVAVAADTAPLHIAGAAGCPLIGLFGATPARRTGPIGRQARMVLMTANPPLSCQPCQQRICRYGTTACMWNLTPETVLAAVCQAIASSSALVDDDATDSHQTLRDDLEKKILDV